MSTSSSNFVHNVVRAIQLAVSISILATAAFLLHYRTEAHSNFTNEPLFSCISGSVAFIYACWAILNRRRHPENHKWIYLHGLCCLIVCGLLITASSLAFIYIKDGILCERFEDIHGTHAQGSQSNLNSFADHPEYEEGRQYAPGTICENSYEEMDKACAVMGILGALMWLIDFGLIFGLCGSSSAYNDQRRRRQRGQIGPSDPEDCYVAEGVQNGNVSQQQDNNRQGVGIEVPDHYRCDTNQRKYALQRLGQRTIEGSKSHIQEPIPLSVQQQNYLSDHKHDRYIFDPSIAVDASEDREGKTATTPSTDPIPLYSVDNTNSIEANQRYSSRNGSLKAPIYALSPPPLPHIMGEQPSEPHSRSEQVTQGIEKYPLTSPTMTMSESFLHHQQQQQGQHEQHEQKDSSTENQLAGAKLIKSSQKPSASHTIISAPPTVPSLCYTEAPSGPTCYIFDSSSHNYRPGFVNLVTRIERQQSRKNVAKPEPTTYVQSSTSLGSTPPIGFSIQKAGHATDVASRDESRTVIGIESTTLHPTGITTTIRSPITHSHSRTGDSYFTTTTESTTLPIGAESSEKQSQVNLDQTLDKDDITPQLVTNQSEKKLVRVKHQTSNLSATTLKIHNNKHSDISSDCTGPASPTLSSSSRSLYIGDF
ncbi:hypothetical protein BX616_006486 [Lobosporangium transversale]|uniref:MARVEL domain-containing protein n=1 Tax=Lobosporangium transversale TaxID=64571 RepID=A0A1Y2GQZ4_9FUNG|nr:hypothetical protein BCR41DRAFT_351020 [Lobosporangium transversale]KAF9915298.1 hypothetical protein BX616_006486 [Lobosporangium transversale]ORZ19943.1 hypothetical protein BCR41DRAFT_351020 [Lobosporangium transversale]|eukprot:XP_021882483.1 hypothetical protein BCR41DRAFT_351020 [Lobosporangium transversale]